MRVGLGREQPGNLLRLCLSLFTSLLSTSLCWAGREEGMDSRTGQGVGLGGSEFERREVEGDGGWKGMERGSGCIEEWKECVWSKTWVGSEEGGGEGVEV